MTIDEVMAEIKTFDETQAGKTYSVRAHISENDFERCNVLSGAPRVALYHQIAIFLARGFHNFALSFEFCDAVVNDIHTVITNLDEIRPTVFREISKPSTKANIATMINRTKIHLRCTRDQ